MPSVTLKHWISFITENGNMGFGREHVGGTVPYFTQTNLVGPFELTASNGMVLEVYIPSFSIINL